MASMAKCMYGYATPESNYRRCQCDEGYTGLRCDRALAPPPSHSTHSEQLQVLWRRLANNGTASELLLIDETSEDGGEAPARFWSWQTTAFLAFLALMCLVLVAVGQLQQRCRRSKREAALLAAIERRRSSACSTTVTSDTGGALPQQQKQQRGITLLQVKYYGQQGQRRASDASVLSDNSRGSSHFLTGRLYNAG